MTGAVPTAGMARFQCVKRVLAGEITEVVESGCYVRYADGTEVLRFFQPHMDARYKPKVGDWWIVYDGGYESISPKEAFSDGYMPIEAPRAVEQAV